MSSASLIASIPAMSPEDWDKLRNEWLAVEYGKPQHPNPLKRGSPAKSPFLERDANHPEFPNGGHRIKSNPLLMKAIEEIRDGYFQFFHQKGYLIAAQIAAQKTDSQNKDWDQAIDDINCDLINHNRASFFRLQSADYGFSPERKAEILAQTPDPLPNPVYELNKVDAANIMGTLIKRSILAFQPVMHYLPAVPHVPLKASPEKTGRHRSTRRVIEPGDVTARPEEVDKWEAYVLAKEERAAAAGKDGETR